MPKVKIICPTCEKNGIIEVPDDKMKTNLRGLLAINIVEGIICSHSFIAYIDKNFVIRDYFVADFNVELPEITQFEKVQVSVPKEILNIDLIRLNITATLLTYILKSIFSKQKVVLILDQEYLYTHITNFFNYITQDTFKTDISLMTEECYKNKKKLYKDSMVFECSKIINNVNHLINSKKLFVEKIIVNKFLTENDLGFSYIVLKNEIQKAYELSKIIVDLINECKKKNETINTLKISTQLEKTYYIKINTIYLKFLIDIVESYFGAVVPSISDSFLKI